MGFVKDVGDKSRNDSQPRAGNTPHSIATGPRLDGDAQAVKTENIQDIVLPS